MWFQLAMAAFSMVQGVQASKAQDKLSEQNRDSAVMSQTYENRSINEGLREDQDIAADQKLEATIATLKNQSTLQARGRNVSGADGQSKELGNELGRAIQQINSTLEGRQRQAEMEKKGTSARAESRINSVPKGSYNPIMDIASTGLSIYGDFKGAQRDHTAATGGKGKLEFSDYFWGRDAA